MNDGRFMARATRWDLGETGKGSLYVGVIFLLDGSEVEWRGYLTPAAQARTLLALRALGWDGVDTGFGARCGLDANEVSITVATEPYTGRDGVTRNYTKVQWIDPVGGRPGGRPAAVDAVAARNRAARARALLASAGAQPGIAAATAAQPRQTTASAEDDIPF